MAACTRRSCAICSGVFALIWIERRTVSASARSRCRLIDISRCFCRFSITFASFSSSIGSTADAALARCEALPSPACPEALPDPRPPLPSADDVPYVSDLSWRVR
jgi:hypothetical protein